MSSEYLQILQEARQIFADGVHDSFGQKILQDVFDTSAECMGHMSQMEDENSNIIAEIRSTLAATQEVGQSIASGWGEI